MKKPRVEDTSSTASKGDGKVGSKKEDSKGKGKGKKGFCCHDFATMKNLLVCAGKGKGCWRCGEMGHMSAQCPNNNKDL